MDTARKTVQIDEIYERLHVHRVGAKGDLC
jgi:hypothetical protein